MRLVFALLLLVAATEVRSAAVLEVNDRMYDAGRVDRGATVRHEFRLKNIGTAELTIDAKPG